VNRQEDFTISHNQPVVLDHEDKGDGHHKHLHRRHSRESVILDDGASEHEPPHHLRHLVEEAIGFWALAREVLGDRKHHKRHILEGIVGANGLIKELDRRR
jgi:hypothetical protein